MRFFGKNGIGLVFLKKFLKNINGLCVESLWFVYGKFWYNLRSEITTKFLQGLKMTARQKAKISKMKKFDETMVEEPEFYTLDSLPINKKIDEWEKQKPELAAQADKELEQELWRSL